jgi:sugar/nucleoside kinase (ribokinase family)
MLAPAGAAEFEPSSQKPAEKVKQRLRFDYTTVGHVTVDVTRDGSRRAGGTAFYSALQAARLGQRTLIVTRGVPRVIEKLLEPYRGELELEILPAGQTTTLETSHAGPARSQRVLAWAGAIDERVLVDTSILHLAPIARETPGRWSGHADFVGLTPQGLVRGWSGDAGEIFPTTPDPRRIPERCQAVVMSEQERASCAELISGAGAAGAIVAVTAGRSPTTLLLPGGQALAVEVPSVAHPSDDVGAGDVFAAAFFIALREGRAPRQAANFANAAAAVRIGSAGAQAIGDRSAIEARLRAAA